MVLLAWLTPLMALCALTQASSWMEQPYPDDSFNLRRDYLANASLHCSDGLAPEPFTVKYWVLPNLKHMGPGDTEEFRTIDGMAGWQVGVSSL